MTVMMLALMFSDATLHASEAGDYSEYRLVEGHDQESAPRRSMRQWTPGLESWTLEKDQCSAFFSRELDGFGNFRVGPRCADEEVPYAL